MLGSIHLRFVKNDQNNKTNISNTVCIATQIKRRSTAYIRLIQHHLTRKSLMISVGTATETVLVRKKGKVLSSLYRIGIKMEYLAWYKWQLHSAGTSRSQTYRTSCWSGWPREFDSLNIHLASSLIFRYVPNTRYIEIYIIFA